MTDQTTDDPRLRTEQLRHDSAAIIAAAVTWWGDQPHVDDLPDGPERDLVAAVDRYIDTLGIEFDRSLGTIPRVAPPRLTLVQRDCGGASDPTYCHHRYGMVAGVVTCDLCGDRLGL